MKKSQQLTSICTAAAVLILYFAFPLPCMCQAAGPSDSIHTEKEDKPGPAAKPDNIKSDTSFSDSSSTEENLPDENVIKGTETSTSLFDLFKKGGPFMWPMLLFAAVALGFMIERFIYFRKARLSPREFIYELENTIENSDLDTVEKLCRESSYTMSGILIRGLRLKNLGIDRVEKSFSVAGSIIVAELERGLSVLSSLGNLAPMLGFLGTVSGMISAFSDIAAADQVNARVVAGGIEEALLTTAAGLVVAIPTLLAYNYFVHRIEIFISDVERVTADILEKMIEENND